MSLMTLADRRQFAEAICLDSAKDDAVYPIRVVRVRQMLATCDALENDLAALRAEVARKDAALGKIAKQGQSNAEEFPDVPMTARYRHNCKRCGGWWADDRRERHDADCPIALARAALKETP